MALLYLSLAFVLNALANVLLKIGAREGIELGSYSPVTFVASNWQLTLGVMIFSANVLFYFLALRELPLSIAYPTMVVMSFIIVNGYALYGLGETITPLQIAGYIAIIAGLALVVTQQA